MSFPLLTMGQVEGTGSVLVRGILHGPALLVMVTESGGVHLAS